MLTLATLSTLCGSEAPWIELGVMRTKVAAECKMYDYLIYAFWGDMTSMI